ncbi:MAG: HAMP domain-containing histidine kinase [Deltaproteobacteria bacterium]|nr:HAMP domain-containing histidine kinase [Candidatus Anaeroferrophillus wilburensis]MBN2889995.1 HAMP domain-containing histidine kinase [Deltaproteobacteria bacterium]
MKIRYKISLWIVGAGLVASLIFFLLVLHEMTELAYDSVDAGLKRAGKQVAAALGQHAVVEGEVIPGLDPLVWVTVVDHKHAVIYRSPAADDVEVPLHHDKRRYTANVVLADGELLPYRVRVTEHRLEGHRCRIQLAMLVTAQHDELFELTIMLLLGLVLSALVLAFISYMVAGRIIRPLATINQLAKEINGKTLDKRIPLGKSDDELRQLSSSLNHMFDRLQHSFLKQKQFIASAAHELKTPIAMLRLFMDNAMNQSDYPDSLRRQLVEQDAILCRMERLVKTLLDLSALELKELVAREAFNLTQLIRSVIHDFAPLLAERRVSLETSLPDNVQLAGDYDKIRRVMINLLDNALAYNCEGGRIRVEIGASEDVVSIRVSNTGPGIPPEDLPRVFDQFYRVEKSRSLSYGGAGLGLAIVKRIVDLHGGTVAMESTKGEWTTAEIRFPQSQ